MAERNATHCDRMVDVKGQRHDHVIDKCRAEVAMLVGDVDACERAAAGQPNTLARCRIRLGTTAVAACGTPECAGKFAVDAKDPALCEQTTAMNHHQEERCRLYFVSRGGSAAACEGIELQPALKDKCLAISRM